MTNPKTIDAIAAKFAEGGAIAIKQGVPRAVVTEAMYRAAITMMIGEVGAHVTVETLRDSANRLEGGENASAPLAH